MGNNCTLVLIFWLSYNSQLAQNSNQEKAAKRTLHVAYCLQSIVIYSYIIVP